MPGQRTNISDREYFQYLRDHPDADTHISRPLIGRTSGEWVLIFSRRINNPNGSFGGVINGTIELSRIKWMFSQVDLGAKGVISMRNEDLDIIARFPDTDGNEIGPSEMTASPQLREFIQNRRQYGMFNIKPINNGIERIIAVRRVGQYPLYLTVGLAPEDYLEKWRQEVLNSSIALAVFLLITVLMAMQLNISWFQRIDLIKKLEKNQKLLHSLATMSTDWFWVQDENFCFIDVSDDLLRKYGSSVENFTGKTRWEIGIDKTEEEWLAHKAQLQAHQPFYDFEYCFINDAGERRCMNVSGEPTFDDDGRFTGYRGVGRDVTEQKNYEERIQRMAQYDALTNLPNRALCYDRINQTITIAKREQREFALLYFDLDRFKPVNDQYGHDAGDQLLQMAASRIRYLLRESDTVSRLGGDEFAVLLPVIANHEDAAEVAQKIIVALTSPFTLDGVVEKVCIGVSIGIAVFPQDGLVGVSLLKAADAAMYKSKMSGNCYYFNDGKTNCNISPDLS